MLDELFPSLSSSPILLECLEEMALRDSQAEIAGRSYQAGSVCAELHPSGFWPLRHQSLILAATRTSG